MSYAIRKDGKGFRAVASKTECNVYETWSASVPAVAPSAESFAANVGQSVDAKLDALARAWQYRDYISARSYVGDINPKFAAEGASLAAYGSACWTVLDALKANVQSGAAEMPTTVEQVLALLPQEPTRPAL